MNTSDERDGLIMKAVVEMNGDWNTGIQNPLHMQGKVHGGCIFTDVDGYWVTVSTWEELLSCNRALIGDLTPICTIDEFDVAAAKWKEQQNVETPKVDLSQMYCPIDSPDIESFKKLVKDQLGEDAFLELTNEISYCHKRSSPTAVRVDEGVTFFAKLSWYQHETDYIEFKAPKVNYEELTFGELPRDEKLKLVEHVLDGGVIEIYTGEPSNWIGQPVSSKYKAVVFYSDKKYRIKHVEPITEKELFLREAKHYESIEQMFDSGKFKLVTDDGEE